MKTLYDYEQTGDLSLATYLILYKQHKQLSCLHTYMLKSSEKHQIANFQK